MAKVVKARHWAFVAYPDSVAPDWKEHLKLIGLQAAISPLHDKDEHSDPDVGDNKKPHWHVILSWPNGSTTKAVAAALCERLKVKILKDPLRSVRGYYRYFTHADDPDKYQYDPKEIEHIGGFDIMEHIEMTRAERMKIIKKLQYFIRDAKIYEYADLLDILLDSEMNEMYEVAATNTLLFRGYISSRANIKKEQNDENRQG